MSSVTNTYPVFGIFADIGVANQPATGDGDVAMVTVNGDVGDGGNNGKDEEMEEGESNFIYTVFICIPPECLCK